MKHLTLIFLCLIWTGSTIAAEGESPSPFADKDALYAHFSDPALLKALYFESREVARMLSEECREGENRCRAALDKLNRPFSRWNRLDARNGFHTVVNCGDGTAVTHPNPSLHRILGKSLIGSLRDINGKLWLLGLCHGVGESPGGFWASQFSSWCRSITGLNEVWILSLLIPVPGTDYQVLSHLPHNPSSYKALKAKVAELNSLVGPWSREWEGDGK